MPSRKVFSPLRVVARSFYRSAPTEDLLTRYALEEDGDAFTVLVERFRGFVLRRCRTVLRCEHLAQDAAQETFVALARKAHRLLGPGKMIRWLDKVANNKALDIQRRERRKQRLVEHAMQDAGETSADSLNEGLTRNEMVEQVNEALVQLPQKYRQVLELCFLDGLTQNEAAAILGKPLGTVAWRVQQGLGRLKVVLTRHGIATVAIGALPGFFAHQAEAAPPLAARLLADAALTAAGGGNATVKMGLFGLFSYRGWSAVVLASLVTFGGSATAWWLNTKVSDPEAETSKPKEQVVIQETLQQKNLRLLDHQVLPKVIEALKAQASGNAEVVVVSREAPDHRVLCQLELRRTAGPGCVTYALEYDTLGAEFSLRVDLFGTGHFKRIDPNRPIVLGQNPFTGKEMVIPSVAVNKIETAFREMPFDIRAIEERTRLWEEQVREDGRAGLFPGPIRTIVGNSKHLYLATAGNWLWAGNIEGPNRLWRCIGRGGGDGIMAANDDSLFTFSGNHIVARPSEGISLRWQPLFNVPRKVRWVAATRDWLFYVAEDTEFFGRLLADRSGTWKSFGHIFLGWIFSASGETLYSGPGIAPIRQLGSHANANLYPWIMSDFSYSKEIAYAANGRFWSIEKLSDGCWSCPIEPAADTWRLDGSVLNMFEPRPSRGAQVP
jgi:RNA polymerase sigma factor (sigma-70 family)